MTLSKMTLSDEDVIKMRDEVRSGKGRLHREYAVQYRTSKTIIARALRGQTFAHLNKDHPPAKIFNSKHYLKDQVIELYKSGHSYNAIVKMLDISKSTVSTYCRHLRMNHPEITIEKKINPQIAIRAEKTAEAQRLYLDGYTQREIAETLSISVSTVTTYCGPVSKLPRKDRVAPRRPGYKPAKVMSNQDVIDMRNEVRMTGVRNLRHYADKFGINFGSVSFAISGKTFKHLNDVCPPVTEKLSPYSAKPRNPKYKLPEEIIQKVIQLRRDDPVKWTYAALAKYISEKVGRKYTGGPVSIFILNRAPELKALENIKVPKPPKPPKPIVRKIRGPVFHDIECVICEKIFKSTYSGAEVCSSKKCQDIIAMYD